MVLSLAGTLPGNEAHTPGGGSGSKGEAVCPRGCLVSSIEDHMTDLFEPALDYLRAGLHILALNGKRPSALAHGDHWSWDDSFHGVPLGVEQDHLRNIFQNPKVTGIAILIPPGFLVADVDSERAAQLLVDLGFEATEETVCAKTKNGLHVWFWAPGQERNRWLGDGNVKEENPTRTLLFKGHGGYVVAPPSLHFDDKGIVDGVYEWITPLVVDGVAQFPDQLPFKVAQRMKAEDQYAAAKPEREAMQFFTMTPADGVPWWLWEKHWDYQTEGLERAIETAADGNQNNVIHWAAMKCREEGVPYEIAMERLMAAAERGNHPRIRARDTIRGAYKRAARV